MLEMCIDICIRVVSIPKRLECNFERNNHFSIIWVIPDVFTISNTLYYVSVLVSGIRGLHYKIRSVFACFYGNGPHQGSPSKAFDSLSP